MNLRNILFATIVLTTINACTNNRINQNQPVTIKMDDIDSTISLSLSNYYSSGELVELESNQESCLKKITDLHILNDKMVVIDNSQPKICGILILEDMLSKMIYLESPLLMEVFGLAQISWPDPMEENILNT